MKDNLLVASAILGGALLLSAIIIALSLASLGSKVEQAGQLAHGGTSVSFPDHLTLSTGNDRIKVILGNNTPLKVQQVK